VTADLRDAWAHEAHGFTPWLYENLDQLSEALGIPLEAAGAEVPVESFSADILAHNPLDDSRVLIENQLECSDHTHLGQILTYLAGLQARTVVWIAREFREPHLAAIKWLNEHTSEEFSFFAVQLRVVRIANSPLAPIFDVVERPNNWERRSLAEAAQRESTSAIGTSRTEFWSAYLEHVPADLARSGPAKAASNRWREVPGLDLIISYYVAVRDVGIFIRGLRGSNGAEVRDRLLDVEPQLTQRLNTPIGESTEHFFISFTPGNYQNPEERPRLVRWLAESVDRYEAALLAVFGTNNHNSPTGRPS
jgi:hypothetical protein